MTDGTIPNIAIMLAWGVGGVLAAMLIVDLIRTFLARANGPCRLMRRLILPDRCVGDCPKLGQRMPFCAETRSRPYGPFGPLTQAADCACALPVGPGGGGGAGGDQDG